MAESTPGTSYRRNVSTSCKLCLPFECQSNPPQQSFLMKNMLICFSIYFSADSSRDLKGELSGKMKKL